MGNKFISSNRGKALTKQADFTFDTSSTAGDDLEIRIADGASLTRADVIRFCDGIKRIMQSGQLGGMNFPLK
jgi:hypothetical protein